MFNITELKNFPEEIKKNSLEFFNDLENQSYDIWSSMQSAFEVPNKYYDYFFNNLPLLPKDIYIYKFKPGLVNPHVDRGRKTALQIPISRPLKNFIAYSIDPENINLLKENCEGTYRPPKEGETIKIVNEYDKMMFFYNKNLCHHYENNVNPYLMDVSIPHGGINKNIDNFYMWSISYHEDYQTVCDYYKNWN
jgi:hypothetical protein